MVIAAAKDTATMSQWIPEDDEEDLAFANSVAQFQGGFQRPQGPQATTKAPPSYDGSTLWFPYEEAVREWNDLTELEPFRRGPALRSQLIGAAATYSYTTQVR